MDARVYTDPQEPGAPQPGDVVVVVTGPAPGTWASDEVYRARKDMGRKVGVAGWRSTVTRPHWCLRDHPWYVHSVRRPTEAELAAWALGGGQ